MHWLYIEFTKITTAVIWMTQLIVHWEDIIDRFSGWMKIGHLIERRKHMGLITEVEALAKLIPQVEKTIADIKVASTDPSVVQAVSDLEALVAELKASLNPPTA